MGGFSTALSLGTRGLDALLTPAVTGVAAWFLAGVFVWSGVTKVRRPALAAMALVDFGVARRVWPRLGLALGVTELALAATLAVVPRAGAIVAVAILWAFTLVIARSLRTGERFPCACFGESADQLSGRTLARAALLAGLATVLACRPAPIALGRDPAGAALEAMVAGAIIGAIVLGGQLPNLLRWNSAPAARR
jgi:signal transduction histidine kinase